ncbi:SAM-dependent methyltransferase [Maridesulfovibrio sp.]|uniref:SAM-dependent methyltransferase n=1 Tax=Maridesulfovibrio sp. TaxID=2795000 RepID=UPI003BAC50EA
MNADLKSIGHIATPYNTVDECPANIDFNGPDCRLLLDEEYKAGIKGLKPGESILILYWLDDTDRTLVSQHKRNKTSGEMVGTFSLRSPHRPNPIGAAVTPIINIKDGTIAVKGLDCLNGTTLLDIKPAIKIEK